MGDNEEIYFQFKGSLQIAIDKSVYLKDIAYISCSDELRSNIENIRLLPKMTNKAYLIRAVDIIQAIRDNIGNTTINLLGKENILINPKNEERHDIITIFIVVITSLLLFVGAGLAIIYFHEDVNMHETHRKIYEIVTGIEDNRPLIISIPYSIGLGLGIAIFFDVFSLDRKRDKPGPLEIELYKYNKEIEEYKLSIYEKK
ncbi:MAG TPA: hypothetical protein GX392_04340 [Clostridiales bacterium]|nr:hypothetical protein [Clostridiales bacterium]